MRRFAEFPRCLLICFLSVLLFPLDGFGQSVSDFAVTSTLHSQFGQAEASGVIDAKPEAVWGVLTDYAHQAQFMPNVAKCLVKEQAGNRVRLYYEIGFSVFTTSYTAELIEREPFRQQEWRVVAGDFNINDGGWELIPGDPGKTILRYRVRISHRYLPDFLILRILTGRLPEIYNAISRRAVQAAAPGE